MAAAKTELMAALVHTEAAFAEAAPLFAASDAWLLARRNELHQQARAARHYLATSEAPRIGGAGTACYRAHRNRRQANLHSQRLSEMRQRAEAAEAELEKLPLLYEYRFLLLGQASHPCHKSLLF